MAIVCKVSDIAPGEIAAFEVGGEQVAIANVGGRFYAIGDTCTHRGCSLSAGELSGSVVTCPCHGGQFDMTSGEVVGGPPGEPIGTYAVQVSGDEIRIG
jgi:nitrite reductase/ring-hydroxylating ferredoxin subunit